MEAATRQFRSSRCYNNSRNEKSTTPNIIPPHSSLLTRPMLAFFPPPTCYRWCGTVPIPSCTFLATMPSSGLHWVWDLILHSLEAVAIEILLHAYVPIQRSKDFYSFKMEATHPFVSFHLYEHHLCKWACVIFGEEKGGEDSHHHKQH